MAKGLRGAAAVLTVALVAFLAGGTARAQSCPGGDALTGFQLMVAPPPGGAMLPLGQVNQVQAGDMLWYLPRNLPAQWRHSGRVAILLIPSAEGAANLMVLAARPASRPAAWTVPAPAAAVALLFGPKGFDAGTIRKLAKAHPEMIRNFIDYASQATRVEALVALLARYEESAPGSMDLNAMLHRYAERYGVRLPKVNPALPPEETASELLRAVAPPTAQEDGGSPHAALAADSQSAAAAVASLYFAPVVGAMGVASSSVPLVKALHGMMFPGTAFRGAFAVPGDGSGGSDGGGAGQPAGMALCTTNAAPQAHKRLAYLWMTRIPGDAAPAMRLLGDPQAPAGWQAKLAVTCDSVAQLRALMRARDWALVSGGGRRYPVPVQVNVGATQDELAMDLRHSTVPPGKYQLSADWDWTPVVARGTVEVKPAPALAAARLAPGSPPLVSGGGTVAFELTGADFSLVRKARLVDSKGHGIVAALHVHPVPGGVLRVNLDTSALAPGAYSLRLQAANGQTGRVALTVLAPNPTLAGLPLTVHLGQRRPTVWLEGKHLDEIESIASPGADWTIGAAEAGGRRRAATIVPSANWVAGQIVGAEISVAGRTEPIRIADAIRVAPPLPAITAVREAPFDGPIALAPGELPAEAMVSFSVRVQHAGSQPTFTLGCPDPAENRDALQLQPGIGGNGGAQLEAAGRDLYYLAFQPGAIGHSGCQLELTVKAAGVGDSPARPLGRIVRLPRIEHFTLSDDSAGPGQYAGTLTGVNLQLISATGWNGRTGVPVLAVPIPAAGPAGTQRLEIAMPWPPPAPHAALYIWLRGESQGRKTDTHF